MHTILTCRIQWTVILAVAFLAGCKKESEHHDLRGRVVLINSDEPVPDALVRFLAYIPSNDFGGGSYSEVSSVITGADGYFTIPDDPTIESVQAFGLEEWFYDPDDNAQQDITGYRETGNFTLLELVPRSWLRISAVDIEPLNPEIETIALHINPGQFPGLFAELDEPYIIPARGNTKTIIGFRYVFTDGSTDYETMTAEYSKPFDTTDFVIEF